ncbi:hypothetical protein LOK49_LG10G01191 [Camellia lanceoleosa]|uniref:Uncharacterized protein n=1 Tax=Camellia lanceoleosa TaxID=1840588 RepID=A0ACC0GB84_9ERIC|nr:hypothetical protein LOK49_LG10G01191 [Camellia lanceoleosa]
MEASGGNSDAYRDHIQNDSSPVANNGGEVSIRIIGAGKQEHDRLLPSLMNAQNEAYVQPIGRIALATSVSSVLNYRGDSRSDHGVEESGSQSLNGDGEAVDGAGSNSRDSSYQRYDIQQAVRWIEQVLLFSLLLLVVFIRQHLQDTLVRQAAMVLKCILLMYYKNSRGRNYRRQGQMLTLVEYLLLLYRALLPAPVWYRFFLNKDYGSLFSSLMTGLYLTFKLTSVVEKVQSFFAALKALSRKESHYSAYATSEQVVQFSFFMHPTEQFP